jgi:hypothetical protein
MARTSEGMLALQTPVFFLFGPFTESRRAIPTAITAKQMTQVMRNSSSLPMLISGAFIDPFSFAIRGFVAVYNGSAVDCNAAPGPE